MKLTTLDIKQEYEVLGIVKGSTVRVKHVGKDIIAGFKHIVGGEIREYTEMLEEARQQALDRMLEDAEKLNADAIIGMRFTTSQVMQGAAEILAYGTAVKIKKK
ncbi:YbjQ family protein [Candidatus Micrarchaeota archaeon]|nr:YbjQ family protein [Candidatus Micrarchaeota archaeon]